MGLFFSLGVDSFYSLLKNVNSEKAKRITHLINIHGFDIYYGRSNTGVFPMVQRGSNEVAEKLRMKAIHVATNIRDISDRFAQWGTLYNGAALASIGLAFNGMFGTIYMASSYSYSPTIPLGVTPTPRPAVVYQQHQICA